MRFCVGDADTTCRAGEGGGGGGGEYNNIYSNRTDTAETVSSVQQTPETQKMDSMKESLFQGDMTEDARAEAPLAEAGDKPEEVELELPFCFMTVALNAMPFITHHAPVFDEVGQILSERAAAIPANPNGNTSPKTAGNPRAGSPNSLDPEKPPEPESFWEWHVVEGVAAGRANHGSPYSRRRIPEQYFDSGTGLSVDGTTQYLDGIGGGGAGANAPSFPGQRRVYVHRRCGEPFGSRRTPERPAGAESGSNPSGLSAINSTGIPAAGAGAGAHAEAESREGSGHEPRGGGIGVGRGGFGGGGGIDETGATSASCLWRDKIQMVNSVAFSLEHECLLVQIDADELWTAEQLVRLRDMFLLERNGEEKYGSGSRGGGEQQLVSGGTGGLTKGTGSFVNREDRQKQHNHNQRNRECAYFDCHFFVGPDLVTVTEDGWGHSTSNEWLRAWVFRPRQSVWLQHAPPELARHDEAAGWKMLAGDQCIGREETRQRGLVFTHYAYVLEEQVGRGGSGPRRNKKAFFRSFSA